MKPSAQNTNLNAGRKIEAPKTRLPPRWWLNTVTNAVNAVMGLVAIEVDENGKETGKTTLPTMSPQGGIKLPVQKGGGGGSGSAGSEKGEWSPTYSGGYPIYSRVFRRGGVMAGYYMSLVNANTSEPGNSSTWLMIVPGGTVGNW